MFQIGDYVVIVNIPSPERYRLAGMFGLSSKDYEEVKGKVGTIRRITKVNSWPTGTELEQIEIACLEFDIGDDMVMCIEIPDPDTSLSITYATPLRFSEHLTADQELDVIMDLYNAGAIDAAFRDELIRIQQNPVIPSNKEQREALENLTDRLLLAVTDMRNKKVYYDGQS
jgi:hypothetical protein